MNSGRTFAILILLFAIIATVGDPKVSADRPQVSGSYRVSETTDLGSQIRVTLRIRLVNQSNEKLFITECRLSTALPVRPRETAGASVILDPRGVTDFAQVFTSSKWEYELQQKRGGPLLFIKALIGGNETTLVIPLRREPRMKGARS